MLQALIGPATKLLGKFIEDKDVKNKLARKLQRWQKNVSRNLQKVN